MVMDLPARGIAPIGGMVPVGQDSSGRKSRKKRKDPNAPKRATNAYMIFCKERRAALKEEHPELQFGKLGARLGEMWRLMSPEEKRPFENRATGDRDRYKAEMGSYQSANMLKGNAMSQLGINPDDGYSGSAAAGGASKKSKLEDGSSLGSIDYSALDPVQLEMLQQQQQQYMQQFQQQQQQQLAAMAGGVVGQGGDLQSYGQVPVQLDGGSSSSASAGLGVGSVNVGAPSSTSNAKAKNEAEEEDEEEEEEE